MHVYNNECAAGTRAIGGIKMGTLRTAKKRLKAAAKKIEKLNIVSGTVREILVDLNGDKLPDAGLIDTTGDGNIDMIAFDLSGDHEFNLYLADTNQSNNPDVIFMDKNSDGNLQLVGVGDELQNAVVRHTAAVYRVLADSEEASDDDLVEALLALRKVVKEAKKEFA